MESSHADAATTSAPADAKCQPSSSSSMDSSSMEEWRSTHHLHASAASSSCPPTWESDDEDDNYFGLSHIGPRPSDLYGKFTWKIENFAHISKRELRSNIFEVGGYKWYILVYPQGCDVCNHLSLFLCVADYDKLLPGWNHFAQFTIAIVNRDPKKSKYSDTLHRFCKKEHDWGWKKFMELSKVTDGFIVSETLVIKAQVQVIRENSHRLFRCLDSQYRRELVCVYLTNVEGICRRFIDEKREKIGKLMEDTIRWSSFQAFWSTVDDNMRRKLVREKTDVILKAMLKRFFNEKEVTSTLVMDALYSGCKALNHSNKHKKGRINGVEMEERPNSFVSMDNGSFLLAGDILLMLERAATEPLPYYKDEKVHQNRTKDASLGDESGKDSVVRDERRLVELGRRTVEMFVLAYVFSNRIEVAYREAIALKRQEELIREEEAAGQAELELRAKREAAEKEKRARKKQAKQRRKNQKDKEKDVEEKHIIVVQHPRPREDVFSARVIRNGRLKGQQLSGTIRGEHGSQDVSNHNNISDEVIIQRLCAKENGEADSAGWEMYQSETHQDMVAGVSGAASEDSTQSLQCHRKHQRTTLLDDSSSTWSSDSLPSIITRSHGSVVQSFMHMDIKQAPSNREIIKLNNSLGCDDVRLLEADLVSPSNLDADGTTEQSSNCSTAELDAETVILSLKEKTRWLEQRLAEKEEEVVMLQKRLSLVRNQMDNDRLENKFNLSRQASTCTKLQDLNIGKPNSPSKIPEDRYVQCQGTCDIEVAEIFKQPQDSNSQSAACDVTSSRKEKENQVINHPPSWHDLSVSSKTETESYVSEACSLSVSLVSQKFASEETTLAHPSSQIGPSTATVLRTKVSRPSSAPVVAGLQPAFNIAAQYVQTLALSASAASKIGNESSESETESNPAVLEYQSLMPEPIAASGTILCNSSISSAGAPASKSSANAICFSGIESVSKQDLCSSIPPRESELLSFTAVSDQEMSLKPSIFLEGIADAKVFPEPQSATSVVAVTRERSNMNSFEDSVSYHSINNRTSIDFMFGTITPDVLHLEQQRIWQCGYDLNHEPSDDNLLISQQFMPHEQYVNQREKVRDPTECFVWAAQNSQQVEWSQNSNLQPSSLENHSITHAAGQAVVTAVEKLCSAEDFPHLDIINNLFDDDKSSRETIGAYVQQPENHGFQYDPPFLKFNSANFRIEDLETGMSVVHGIDDNDRGFSYAAELAEIPNYENHMNLNREFQCSSGSSMAHLFSGQSRLIDKPSSLNWIGGSFGMPLNGRFDSGQLMMDTHVQYPLQDQHLSMAESASLSFLQNGYSLHNQGE